MTSPFTVSPLDKDIFLAAQEGKAWPFEEARKIIKRYEKSGMPKEVIFETGYGPSGLPHIGTFGEVARTTMVRHAFHVLTEDKVKTHLLCFSDDMDGLRKVPDNVPKKELMAQYLEMPLTQVPDPFEEGYASFGAANNARLCRFLDQFGFSYSFASASDYYKSGRFDKALLKMLAHYDEIMAVILPTLGPERQQTYSPFLPISPRSGKVLQVPMLKRDVAKGTVTYREPETGEEIETEVTGGKVKCQWKADWAMRWVALGIDYEMAGKDLIDSVSLSSKICKILGARPPEGFNYELFLDENGKKISKSKGNGLTIEEWLNYAPTESLSFYMYQKPKTAKRLYFDVIPKAVDEYYSYLSAYARQSAKERVQNPAWHIFNGVVESASLPISFAMLLNLVSASNADNADVLWGFILRYVEGGRREDYPQLERLVGYALRYYQDFVKPHKAFAIADAEEQAMLKAIDARLAQLPEKSDGQTIQNNLLDIGKSIACYQDTSKTNADGSYGVKGQFFQTLYKLLLGQESGPRFGPFIALYGIAETRAMIKEALERAQSSQ